MALMLTEPLNVCLQTSWMLFTPKPWTGLHSPLAASARSLKPDLHAHVSFTSVATHIKNIDRTAFFCHHSRAIVMIYFSWTLFFYPSIYQLLRCLR